MADITDLIGQARAGGRLATDRLFSLLYVELRRIAQAQLAGHDAPMHATSLVHEAYMKLAPDAINSVNDRQHFYAIAARAMRQIIIDRLRAHNARKRGGEFRIQALDTGALRMAADSQCHDDILALDAALDRLASSNPGLAKLVELRFYAGLELSEISVLTGRSERSLKRDWRQARAFLYRDLAADRSPDSIPGDDGAVRT